MNYLQHSYLPTYLPTYLPICLPVCLYLSFLFPFSFPHRKLKGQKTLQLSLSLRDDNIQPDSEVTKHSLVASQRGRTRECRSPGPRHYSGNGYFVYPLPEPGGSPGYHTAWMLKSHRMNNSCLSADEKNFSPRDNSELDGSYDSNFMLFSNNFSLRLFTAYRTFSAISSVVFKLLSIIIITTTTVQYCLLTAQFNRLMTNYKIMMVIKVIEKLIRIS